jgi:hypothetical protein
MIVNVMTSLTSSSPVETADLSPFLLAMLDLAQARLVYQNEPTMANLARRTGRHQIAFDTLLALRPSIERESFQNLLRLLRG